MPSKILRDYVENNPKESEILDHSLKYINKLINDNQISIQSIEPQIEMAEILVKRKSAPYFIACALLYKILDQNPEKEEKIAYIIGKGKMKIIHALIIITHYFNNEDLKKQKMYFWHSINSARILSLINLDYTSVAATLLHHVSREDMPQTIPIDWERKLGKKTISLINTYKKISHFTSKTKNFNNKVREILLVMAQDVRVIFIKMASTLDSLKNSEKIATEDKYLVAKLSKEILAPIADMLGIWHIRWQLEDFAFRILQPQEYGKIAKKFGQENKRTRDRYINKINKVLLREAEKRNIQCEINGRFKHYYSIYKKMKTKQKTFNEIYDVFALRVIVDNIDDCYLILRTIHQLWPPVHKRIKDYIAAPKENGYQTLHTTVVGPGNRLTEFQIRTREMHKKAQFGVAAQLLYKNDDADTAWARKILQTGKLFSQKNIWEEELSKIFQEKIYVYTPKGDIVSLPKGSTPIDFAYQIHSELGHFCKFAIINNQPAELTKKLKNEDVVEIIPDINSEGPDPGWLKFIKTPLAKKQINKLLKQKGLL